MNCRFADWLGQNKFVNINGKSVNKFKMEENNVEELHKSAYFSRVVTSTSGVQDDVKIYIHYTNTPVIQIYQSWIATELSTVTKVKTFRRNIKYVHPNGCKIWKVVKTTGQNLPTL
jgi:indole-3-glycerol phosphate synthase